MIARFSAVKIVIKPTIPCHDLNKLDHDLVQNPRSVVLVS